MILLSTKKSEILQLMAFLLLLVVMKNYYELQWTRSSGFRMLLQNYVLKLVKNLTCRMSSFMLKEKRRALMKAFLESKLNYCSLIQIFHAKIMNNKGSSIHDKALRMYILTINHLSKNSLIMMDPLHFTKSLALKFINIFMSYLQQSQVKLSRSTK